MAKSSPVQLGPQFDAAVTQAIAIARGRQFAGVPAIAVAFGACALALASGAREDEAVAALAVVPDDDSPDGWYDRRAAYVAAIAALGAGSQAEAARFASAVAALAQARALHGALDHDPDAFGLLPAKKFGTLWEWRALVDAYGSERGRHARLAADLHEIVTALAGKPVSAAELLAAFLIDDTVPEPVKGSLRATVTR